MIGLSDTTVERRVSEAFRRLEDLGFALPGDFDFPYYLAASTFDSRTLHTVFALAYIIESEQPLTVRRAFYRAVSTGIYGSTADKFYEQCGERILSMRRANLI